MQYSCHENFIDFDKVKDYNREFSLEKNIF